MKTNYDDMNKAVTLLNQMLEVSHVALSDTLATSIQGVIDEWTVHIGPDVDDAIRDIHDLEEKVADLEDERKANDVLEQQIDDLKESLRYRDEEIIRLQDAV